MGGGGAYYDRNVTDKSRRTSKGFSDIAEERMSRTQTDAAVIPGKRRLICNAKSPVVYAYDVTGSMGGLPKIIFDKVPMMAGQLTEQNYLEEVEISIAAIGDVLCDQAPLQVCDFSVIKSLDEWLQRIWLEGNGGGQRKESYELIAYFYAKKCEMPNAKTPIFLFTGDEGLREKLPAATLREHFGEDAESMDACDVFDELKKKFRNNVFLIHRPYYQTLSADEEIVAQWEKALGKEKVIKIKNDLAIADITLGLFAIVSRKRTLEEYLQDMRMRRNHETGELEPQSEERVEEVREALSELAATIKPVKKTGGTAKASTKKSGRI